MPYNFVASIHTKKLCSRLSLNQGHCLTESDILRFEPLFEELSGNVCCSPGLIGKRVVNFLVVTIEFFR